MLKKVDILSKLGFTLGFLLLSTLAITSLWGCYSFSGSTLPSHLKNIRIFPVEDQTLNPDFSERLTQALVEGYRNKSSLRIVNGKGGCELNVKLLSYAHEAHNISGSDVVDFQISLKAYISFYDNIKNEMIYEEKSLPAHATYSVSDGQTEVVGQRLAIDALVSLVLDNTISGW